MARVIYPADLWQIQRLPQPPEVVLPPADFTEDQSRELDLAMAIIGLLHKPDGTRRSYYGVNRAAQRRWPDKNVRIEDVEALIPAWAIAGCQGIIDVVRQPKWEYSGRLTYHHIHHELKSLAVVLVENVGDGEEAFVMARYLVERMDGNDPPWRFYRIAAKTNYGTYKFVAISHAVPEWDNLSVYCLWHTLHPPRNIHFS